MAFPKIPNLPTKSENKYKWYFTSIFIPAVLWVGLWHLASLRVGQELLLPGPLVVAERLSELVVTADFWKELTASLLRITVGVLGGTILGGVLAVVTWFLPLGHHLLAPMMKTIQATPVVSFILLVLLWTKRDYVPAVVSCLMVLPLVWSSTRTGLEETDPKLLELGKTYGFSLLKTCKLIYFPCAFPYFLTALSNSISLGWKSGVAAEVICQPPYAVGTEMSLSRIYLDTPTLFAWTAVVIVLSGLMERCLRVLGHIFGRNKSKVNPEINQEVSP